MSTLTIDAARKLSSTAQNKLSKQELLKIINTQPVTPAATESYATTAGESSAGDVFLTERRFVELLDERLNSKLNEVIGKLKSAQNDIKTLFDENVKIKKQLLQVETELKRSNFIIKGVLEESNPQSTAAKVIKQVIGLDLDPVNINAFQLGKQVTPGGRPRPILVKNVEQAQVIIRNARKLRQNNDFQNVYIDRDLPTELAKATANLRKRAYEWRRDHPTETAFVKRGVLFINDIEVASV